MTRVLAKIRSAWIAYADWATGPWCPRCNGQASQYGTCIDSYYGADDHPCRLEREIFG